MTLSNQDNWDHSSDKTRQEENVQKQSVPQQEEKKQNRKQFSRLDNNRFFD